MCGSSKFIQSFDEQSTEAKNCKLWYEFVRDWLLRHYSYDFARSVRALSMISVPTQEWSYSYALPEDYIRAYYITQQWLNPQTKIEPPYEPMQLGLSTDQTQRLLFCNITPAYLTYTIRVTNPAVFDVGFVDTLQKCLGAFLAFPITQKALIANSVRGIAAQAIAEAEAMSANEGGDNMLDHIPDFIMERF